MAVRNGLRTVHIIPANEDFSAQLCAIDSRAYSDYGSREGRGFEPRRSPSPRRVYVTPSLEDFWGCPLTGLEVEGSAADYVLERREHF
jgi:hypothetical protein